jgi:hypothetical protein
LSFVVIIDFIVFVVIIVIAIMVVIVIAIMVVIVIAIMVVIAVIEVLFLLFISHFYLSARFPNQSANRIVPHGCGGLGTFSTSSYWSVARRWHTHLVLLECCTSVAHSSRSIGVLHVCGTLISS